MTTLANLVVKLRGDTSDLDSKVRSAGGTIRRFAGQALALAGGAGLGALVSRSLQSADEIGKLSQRIGASTEFMSEMRHVAELSGVSFRTFATSAQRLTRRISEVADTGKGVAQDALAELGLEAEKLAGIPLDDQMTAVMHALAGVEDSGRRARLAMKLFDTEGVALVQTLAGGVEGLEAMRQEARDLGLSLGTDATDGAAAALDAITRLRGSISGAGLSLSTELAPIITKVADLITNVLAPAVGKLGSLFDGIGTLIGGNLAILVQALRGNFSGAAAISGDLRADIGGRLGLGGADARPDDETRRTNQLLEEQARRTEETNRLLARERVAVAG